jgi:hypothetical protein
MAMILLIGWVIIAIATTVVAGAKGRSRFGWFVLGLLLSPLAFLLVLILRRAPNPIPESDSPIEDLKVCPFCAEHIKSAAIVCRYCHRELVPGGVSDSSEAQESSAALDQVFAQWLIEKGLRQEDQSEAQLATLWQEFGELLQASRESPEPQAEREA